MPLMDLNCTCHICRAWRQRVRALELYVEELEEELRMRDEIVWVDTEHGPIAVPRSRARRVQLRGR
jgi:hypothetical protein